jgi:hypothetical protein
MLIYFIFAILYLRVFVDEKGLRVIFYILYLRVFVDEKGLRNLP